MMKLRHLASMSLLFLGCVAFVACGSLRHKQEQLEKPSKPQAHKVVTEEPVSNLTAEKILRDTEGRVSPEFEVPLSLRENTRFWLKVYTQFDSRDFVIYDSQHPNAIYEVLDFRELERVSRNRVAYEIVRDKRIKKVLDAYRNAFAHLARHPSPAHPTREERLILATTQCLPGRSSFRALRASMRTQTGQRDHILKGLVLGSEFFSAMEGIFRQMGLPIELARIPLVESSFETRAQSKAEAVGIWQFLRSSAKADLVIDDEKHIDERLSPLKGTVAAAKLLKANYQSLRSWPLAITAYNHGFKGLSRLKPKENQQLSLLKLFNSERGHRKLGYASRNYYAEFLAIVHAVAYREFFYGPAVAPPSAKLVRFKRLASPAFAPKLASRYGMSLHEFRAWNPDFRDLAHPIPAGSLIAMPSEYMDLSSLKIRQRLLSLR